MHITQASFYKWKNTSCHWTYKWVQIYKIYWFEFWQPSDLTRGLGECPVLVTAPFRKQNHFRKIYGSTPSRNINEMQSTMFVNGMSIEKFAATRDALFSQGGEGVLSQPDSSLMTSQIAAPKIYPGLKPMDGWWKIIVLFPNSRHCLLFQMLVWNWPHALRLLAVT